MKLFKKYDINLSVYEPKFEKNAIFSFGNLLRSKDLIEITTNELGIQNAAVERRLLTEGKFLRIELPFAINKTYTCPFTYEVITSKCKPTWLITTSKHFGKKIMFVWLPLQEATVTTDPLPMQVN